MTKNKKRVLFLRSTPDTVDSVEFQENVARALGPGCELEVALLSELAFYCGESDSRVWNPDKDWDLADFDLVVFRHVGADAEISMAAAHYLHSKSVPFTDHYLLTQGKGKLACGFLRAVNGLPVPQTFFASPELYRRIFANDAPFGYPFVLKADNGRKGRDNYLVHSYDELDALLTKTKGLAMIAQELIPNDGDLRILVLNDRIGLVILRKGNGNTHLNNTSQGGSAQLLPVSELNPTVAADSIRATQAERLQVAGVDVIIDKTTGKHYILEVNRAPQVATGVHTPEKAQVYATMVKELLEKGIKV
ncbi:MAG TPA: hypothetical protein VGM08_02310 [Candidatus Saccharimonadales bacterium]|jgi:glutathione synthase/RimK-type ligase-like ATP-grasp enzyme